MCFKLISLKYGQDSSNNVNYDDKDKDIGQITEYDMDKLRSTIKQFVREWAIEVKASHSVKMF
jgi:hypothetical protein